MEKLGQDILIDIKSDTYKALLKKKMGFFSEYSEGTLISRVESDGESVRQFFTSNTIRLFSDLIILIGMMITAQANWPMFHNDLSLSGYTMDSGPDTNNILWTYSTLAPIESSPAVVDGIVYIGSNDGTLYALDAYSGTEIWSYPTGYSIHSSPAVENNMVYFLSSDGYIYALDASTGTYIWSNMIGPGPWDWSSPAVHDDNVFIGGSSGVIYSFDALTGALNWATFVGGAPDSPISVANG